MGRARLAIFGMVAIAASILCFRLGVWQLRRHTERRALNAARAAALALPVVPLDTVGTPVAPWRRVRLAGTYDDTRQIVVVNRSLDGQPGVVVVTPLLLAAGGAVLVERGWVPAPDAATVNLAGLSEPGQATVFGVVKPPGKVAHRVVGTRWPLRMLGVTPSDVEGRYPYRLHPSVIQALPTPDQPALPRRLEAPRGTAGPHISYAIQWFAFAAIFTVGFAAYAWRRGGPTQGGHA